MFVHTGMPQNPMPKEQFDNKFRQCASVGIGSDKSEEALRTLNQLEELGDIGELIQILKN